MHVVVMCGKTVKMFVRSWYCCYPVIMHDITTHVLIVLRKYRISPGCGDYHLFFGLKCGMYVGNPRTWILNKHQLLTLEDDRGDNTRQR